MRGSWALCFVLGVLLLVAHTQDEIDNGVSLPGDAPGSEPSEDGGDEEPSEGVEEEEESVWKTQDEQLSSDQLRKMHAKMDANGDKKVSMSEIQDFWHSSRKGITMNQTAEDLESMDNNKDGKVDLEEMLEHMVGPPLEDDHDKSAEEVTAEKHAVEQRESETKKFKVADVNGDGFLDKHEFPAITHPDTHEGMLALTAQEGMKELDEDGDGQLTPEEFAKHQGDVESEPSKDSENLKALSKEDFDKLDTDKNGRLSFEEYKAWESAHYHMEEAMKHVFEVADEDSDGHITASELVEAQPALVNSMATMQFHEWVDHFEL